MAWYYGGVRIYVEEDTGAKRSRRQAMIEILDSASTIIHDSGRPSDRRELTFVVFSGYDANILPLCNGSGHELISDEGSLGNWVIVGEPSPNRVRAINYATPVHRVTMELMKDDS